MICLLPACLWARGRSPTDPTKVRLAVRHAHVLLQDALERGYRKRDRFQPGTNMRAWLLQIMRNLWISSARQRAGAPHLVQVDDLDEATIHGPAVAAAPAGSEVEAVVLDRLSEAAIMAIIETLPRRLRDVVVLADVEDVSYNAIAARLRIPIGSVCSRLSRGRQRLRRALAQHAQAAGALARAG